MATFGQLQVFNPDTDSVTAYIERVHLFFAANEIPDKKTVAVFHSTIGGKTYELLRNLVSPKPPESLKLLELTDILKLHYEPQPLVIAERFHFHRRFQTADESIAEFMAQLRRLSQHCDFQDYFEQALRDRLVCGLRNEGIHRRLLAEAKLTLARALEIAQGMEAAERNAQSLKGSEAAVHKMNTSEEPATQRPPTRAPCYRCGRATHDRKTADTVSQSATSVIKRVISHRYADSSSSKELAASRTGGQVSIDFPGRSFSKPNMSQQKKRLATRNYRYMRSASHYRDRFAPTYWSTASD